MSPLAKVVPYFSSWLHGGGIANPAFEMQVSPSSLDRIFYGWIFWKAYGWNCGQKSFFFRNFSQNFFSTSQNEVDFVKIGDFLQSVLCWLYFPAERSKNVTNRK